MDVIIFLLLTTLLFPPVFAMTSNSLLSFVHNSYFLWGNPLPGITGTKAMCTPRSENTCPQQGVRAEGGQSVFS